MCVHLPSDAFRRVAWHIEVQFHAFVGLDFWNFFHGKFLNFHGNLLRCLCRRGLAWMVLFRMKEQENKGLASATFSRERKWKPLSLVHADSGESLREPEHGSFIWSLHGWIVAKRAHKKVRKDE